MRNPQDVILKSSKFMQNYRRSSDSKWLNNTVLYLSLSKKLFFSFLRTFFHTYHYVMFFFISPFPSTSEHWPLPVLLILELDVPNYYVDVVIHKSINYQTRSWESNLTANSKVFFIKAFKSNQLESQKTETTKRIKWCQKLKGQKYIWHLTEY